MLLLLYSTIAVHGQEKASKSIDKSFEFSNMGALRLENKYGNIIIQGWNQDKIKIKIDILVNKKEKTEAQELLNRIKPVITASKDYLKINTEIEEKSNNFLSRFWNQNNPFEFDKGNIKIDYKIYLPTTAEIEVSNKFGDIIIGDWTGKLKANIQHGDLWIKNDLVKAWMDIQFGKLETKSIDYATILLKNSELELGKCKKLRLNSSGSVIDITEVTNLEISSNKDKIIVENSEKIQGSLKFSNFRLERLKTNLDMELDISDLWINKIEEPDAVINLYQESSEIQINISNLSFDFNAHLEQGMLRIPTTFNNIKTNMLDSKKKIREVTARYGTSKKQGTFEIRGKKGVVILKESQN